MINNSFLHGMPIYFAAEKRQRRIHRKKRINKKWLKKYGIIGELEKGKVLLIDNKLVMTRKTYSALKAIYSIEADKGAADGDNNY